MPSFKRRHFLQLAGSTLASLGLSQLDLRGQGDRYARVLAQETSGKLALLVGINDYPSPVRRLNGCINDVYLQRELLIHRFGFDPNNIKVLTDDSDLKPTRDNILQAFQRHLIDQARPGDVVVFHYSGHGSRVIDPNPPAPQPEYSYNGTLVPYDAAAIAEQENKVIVPDITGRTLFLLMESIKTDYLTVVLDSCYAGASTRGNATVRADSSRLSRSNAQLVASDAEFELQKRLLANLGWSEDEFQQRRRQGIAKGVALGSASRNQEALDAAFEGFNAGAFTYLLTRYLWQLTREEAAVNTAANLKRSTEITARASSRDQVPTFEYAEEGYQATPLYFTAPSPAFAEAVVTKITGDQVEFWLGGTSSQNLAADQTIYRLIKPDGQMLTAAAEKPMLLQKTSRNGLYGYGKMIAGSLDAVRPGTLLREQVLGVAANPTLKVQVDSTLGREADAARAALATALLSEAGVSRLEVSLLSSTAAADYLFGRFTAQNQASLANLSGVSTLPPLNTLGLFTAQGIPIDGTFGFTNETVNAAVNRLKPKLKLFLANQILRGLASSTSRLAVAGEIFSPDRPEVRIPITPGSTSGRLSQTSVDLQTFKTKEDIQIRLNNRERDRALYLSCLAIDSQGNLIVLYPGMWDVPEEAARIDRNSELVIPRPEDNIYFRVDGSGFLEIITLVSTSPLRKALKGLQSIARSRGISRGFLAVEGDQPLAVLDDLLADVDQLSRGNTATIGAVSTAPSSRQRDTDVLAAFSTTIEVVEA
ncbi:MAG: caspase family protein [Nodosilinea sp.]